MTFTDAEILASHRLGRLATPGRDASIELEGATELYAAGPEEGEHHSFELRMLAHIELAVARLRTGDLDGVKPALRPVLDLPPGKRGHPENGQLAVKATLRPRQAVRRGWNVRRPAYSGRP